MKNTVETLNDISKKHDNCSDYKMAAMFGVSRQWMSDLRNGRRTMSDQMRIKAAELLDQEPDEQLIYGRIERAKCTEIKHAWQHTLKRLTASAAALFVAVGLALPLDENDAEPELESTSVYYVKSAFLLFMSIFFPGRYNAAA